MKFLGEILSLNEYEEIRSVTAVNIPTSSRCIVFYSDLVPGNEHLVADVSLKSVVKGFDFDTGFHPSFAGSIPTATSFFRPDSHSSKHSTVSLPTLWLAHTSTQYASPEA